MISPGAPDRGRSSLEPTTIVYSLFPPGPIVSVEPALVGGGGPKHCCLDTLVYSLALVGETVGLFSPCSGFAANSIKEALGTCGGGPNNSLNPSGES
jgi:hypothetical protein